jgi:VanZ family protein
MGEDLMRTRLFRLLAWILVAAVLALSLVPPSWRPITGTPHNFEHFAIFSLCGCAFGLGYRSGLHVLTIGLVAFSGLVEILQLMTPGRHARVTDFIVDALASCAGVVVGRITLKRTVSEGASAGR